MADTLETIGKIVFWSMIALIIIIAAIIILILALAFSASRDSSVYSPNGNVVANRSNDAILDCIFPPDTSPAKVQITWKKDGLSGVVHMYKNNRDELQDQNSAFKGRTQIFAQNLFSGNASLKLQNVQFTDTGTYRCTVSTSSITGDTSVYLGVGVYTFPTISENNNSASNQVLKCMASGWYPKPTVNWQNSAATDVTEFSETNVTESDVFNIVSLLNQVAVNNSYSCIIQNQLVKATAVASITDTGITNQTSVQILGMATKPSCHTMVLSILVPLLTYFLLS